MKTSQTQTNARLITKIYEKNRPILSEKGNATSGTQRIAREYSKQRHTKTRQGNNRSSSR